MSEREVAIFKNDEFFQGTVVLAVSNFTGSTFLDLEVTVIPDNLAECPSGGGMLWELTIDGANLESIEEVFEEIKKEEYATYGCSVTIDVYAKEEK